MQQGTENHSFSKNSCPRSMISTYHAWMMGEIVRDLFNSDRFCEVAREINVESLSDSKPIGNKLQWNNVEKTLQTVDGPWDLNLFGLGGRELWVVMVTNHNRATAASNH